MRRELWPVLLAVIGAGGTLHAQVAGARETAKHAFALQDAGQWRQGGRLLREAAGRCAVDTLGRACRTMVANALGFLYQRAAGSSPDSMATLLAAAADAYGTALKESRGDSTAIRNLVAVYRDARRDSDLIGLLRYAIQADPEHRAEYSVLLGDAYRDQGALGTALGAYRVAMTDDPDDEYSRSRFVEVYRRLPPDSAAGLFTFVSASPDWESRFPNAALEAYGLVMRRGPRPIADSACVRWVRLLSETGLLSASLLTATDSWLRDDLAALRGFLIDPHRTPFSPLWRTPSGRDAIVVTSLALGREASARGDAGGAEAYWNAGLQVASFDSPATLSLGQELAGLYYRRPILDPDGRKFRRIEESLIGGKAAAIRRADAETEQQFHAVLGMIYAERGVWGASDRPWSALYQLEQALVTAQKRDEQTRSYQALPQLRELLGRGYAATGQPQRAQQALIDAATAYLDVDDLHRSGAMLLAAREQPGAPGNPKLAALGALLASRQQAATAGVGVRPAAEVCDTIGAGAVEGAARVNLPPSFLARQRFKLGADCALSGPAPVSPAAAAHVLTTLAQDPVPLVGIGDLLRVQRSQAVLRRVLQVPGEASHQDLDRPDAGPHGAVLPLSVSGHLRPSYVTVSPEAVLGARVVQQLGVDAGSVKVQVAHDTVTVTSPDTLAARRATAKTKTVMGARGVLITRPPH